MPPTLLENAFVKCAFGEFAPPTDGRIWFELEPEPEPEIGRGFSKRIIK
jgi:hypothetical protein